MFLYSCVTGSFLQRVFPIILSSDHSSFYWNLGFYWKPKVTNHLLVTKFNRERSAVLLLTSLQHLTHPTTSSFPWFLWHKDPLILLLPLGFCLLCRLFLSVLFLFVGVSQNSILKSYLFSCYFPRVSSHPMVSVTILRLLTDLWLQASPPFEISTCTIHCPLGMFT